MDLGHWDTAIIRSVFVSSLLLPAFHLIHIGGFQVSEILGLLVFFLLYIGVFLLASIAGWVVVGLPVHWLARLDCRLADLPELEIELPGMNITLCAWGDRDAVDPGCMIPACI